MSVIPKVILRGNHKNKFVVFLIRHGESEANIKPEYPFPSFLLLPFYKSKIKWSRTKNNFLRKIEKKSNKNSHQTWN
jgi:hypothetical protein